VLAALAEATRRVELGTLVLCNAFRNPALLAKMASTMDEVSNGRFILGIGAGWNTPEFQAFGIPFGHRVTRFEEALHIIAPLLRQGYVDFTGHYYQARDCEIVPRGPRASGPPLLIGGNGPRLLRLAAQYADMWNAAYLSVPDSLVAPQMQLQAACAEVGRDPASIAVTATIAMSYPALGAPDASMTEYLSGSPAEIVAALHSYEQMGVSHLMFQCFQYNETALGWLAEAVQEYRAQSSRKARIGTGQSVEHERREMHERHPAALPASLL
jgi:alkanesulfonate monooxygenase SsuD/methylene tetrahydromethanopterin reductase-like flavin-dependent oxidoreductase (luciferase family)